MAVRIGHASIDESGRAKNGSAGDQTGKEVCIRSWYHNTKGWVVLRCKDDQRREKIAEAMELACNNPHIGYDQNQRVSLWNNVKDKGYDPSKTTKPVETDCSALVRLCIAYAYQKDVAGNIRTISEPAALVKTGLFEKLTADKYTKSSDNLLRGDILCTPVSGHTVVVLDNGKNITEVFDMKLPVLKRGHKGESVKALQAILVGYGYTLDVDGDFGPATESAVRKFQSRNYLALDGIVGQESWGKLLGVA